MAIFFYPFVHYVHKEKHKWPSGQKKKKKSQSEYVVVQLVFKEYSEVPRLKLNTNNWVMPNI